MFSLQFHWVRELLNDTGLRTHIDGSSDKHRGNERQMLMDLARLPLMGSGLFYHLLMREREGKGKREIKTENIIKKLCCAQHRLT